MKRLNLAKPVTIESRKKSEYKETMETYYSDVKSSTGGILFAVCRGKVNIFVLCLSMTFSNPNETGFFRGREISL